MAENPESQRHSRKGTEPDLVAARQRAKELCHAFNQLPPSVLDPRNAILQDLFGKTGDRYWIMQPFWCDYGYNIEVGDNFFANHFCVILDAAPVRFGANVLIGPQCGFHAFAHSLDPAERMRGMGHESPIEVGDNVWIGAGTQVLGGVHIGANTVIGAGSVVTRSIPDGVVAVGSPCRVLREIGPQDMEQARERRTRLALPD